MIVRSVRPEDFERVGDIVVDAYLPFFGNDLGGYDQVLRDVAGRASRVEVLVAELDGAVVGSTTYVPGPGPDSDFGDLPWASIRMLAVAPEGRGRGIGRALVEACLDRARRDGRRYVGLHTDRGMTAAHALYGSYGFVRHPANDFTDEDGFSIVAYRLDLEPTEGEHADG